MLHKILFLSLVFIILGFSVTYGIDSSESLPNDIFSCSVDSDCIKIKSGEIGRACTAINNKYLDYWKQRVGTLELSENDLAAGDMSCVEEQEPRCYGGRCNLILERPVLMNPWHNDTVFYSENKEFSFGWFPAGRDGEPIKHIIQVSRDPDFNSFIINTDETGYGSYEMEEALPEGTYYWRVCSSKNNLWSKVRKFTVRQGPKF